MNTQKWRKKTCRIKRRQSFLLLLKPSCAYLCKNLQRNRNRSHCIRLKPVKVSENVKTVRKVRLLHLDNQSLILFCLHSSSSRVVSDREMSLNIWQSARWGYMGHRNINGSTSFTEGLKHSWLQLSNVNSSQQDINECRWTVVQVQTWQQVQTNELIIRKCFQSHVPELKYILYIITSLS